jgi:WD40 repeat protein
LAGKQRTVLTGHSAVAVTFSPGGTWLATASDDCTIRIWVTAGQARAVMRADRPLTGLAWGPTGRLLAVSGDADLYLYAFTPGGSNPASL